MGLPRVPILFVSLCLGFLLAMGPQLALAEDAGGVQPAAAEDGAAAEGGEQTAETPPAEDPNVAEAR